MLVICVYFSIYYSRKLTVRNEFGGRGMKRSWSIRRYCTSIHLMGLKKSTNHLRIVGL
jgi:hypothetical protein